LRSGFLEHLLTRRNTKEHKAILAADIDGRDLPAALLLVGAEPGRPFLSRPKEIAPSGSSIRISLAYNGENGKSVRVPARQWIRHIKAKCDSPCDWVFAGSSFLVNNHDPGEVYYLANDGDIICVANFETALLDVPIHSSASGVGDYEAHTERIPPLGTAVQVILEPVRVGKD
jgi:hypothetical protein